MKLQIVVGPDVDDNVATALSHCSTMVLDAFDVEGVIPGLKQMLAENAAAFVIEPVLDGQIDAAYVHATLVGIDLTTGRSLKKIVDALYDVMLGCCQADDKPVGIGVHVQPTNANGSDKHGTWVPTTD